MPPEIGWDFCRNQGIYVDKIINPFSKESKEEIFPALSPPMMGSLIEEFEHMDYLNIEDGKAAVTKKGAVKLEDFKKSLSAEEREALEL